MNELNSNSEDSVLKAHLRDSRPAAPLPPRFRENVWRRIEAAESASTGYGLLQQLAALVLRPRLALATGAVLIVAGALLGVQAGNQVSHRDAQVRYVATVAPNILR